VLLEKIADGVRAGEGAPLHLQIKSAIAQCLSDGTWKPGDKLPTEGELSRSFGVSEGTVRQAVIALVREGRLTRRSGKGTFATRPNFERSFARFFRFRRDAQDGGPDYALDLLGMQVEPPPDATTAQRLGLRKSGKVLAIHRAIRQDKLVVVHYVSYLSEPRFGKLRKEDLENAALYDALSSRFGVHVVRAVETLQARAARREDAAILGVDRDAPVIAIERLAYTHGDEIVEVRRAAGRSDNFKYEIELS
jgi:GntR family transcriptional regulator